jgi:hypothetical protein
MPVASKSRPCPVHPLDRPIWSALTTRQQGLAEGGALARRYPPAIAPFADMVDMSPKSFAALGAILSGSEIAVLFTPDAVTAPDEFKIVLAETGEQMIGTAAESSLPGVEIVTLGVNDVPEMIALTELTKPGPFSARTHELGTFLGIRIDGQLVAMTGERMKPGNYTEMTAVCVHPITAAAVTRKCCLARLPARSCRAERFRSCMCFRTTHPRSRSTGGREWKSAVACV